MATSNSTAAPLDHKMAVKFIMTVLEKAEYAEHLLKIGFSEMPNNEDCVSSRAAVLSAQRFIQELQEAAVDFDEKINPIKLN